jgi:superfamily II DNA or RNA helicase
MIELRDYQQECVERILAAYKHHPSGQELVVLPCAAGKTLIFSTVIDTLARVYGVQGLVLAHLDELLDQARDKYHMVKPHAIVGKVGSGVYEYGGEVTVAGIQTISRPNHLKSLRALYGTGKKLIIVVDEAHLSAAPSYKRVLEAFPDAFVLKVTATPYRLDNRLIINKTPIYERTIQEMIKEGYLCDIRAIAIKTETNLDDIKTTAGDFDEHELDLAINTPARNKRIVEAYQEHAPGKRALVFCVTVAHAEALAYCFNDHGINAAVVTGKTPLTERRRLYAAFDRGEILVLTTVNVLSIGFDSPRAEVAIQARPTQSQALYVQQIGRVLRLAPGKKYALLLDITDNSLRLRVSPQNYKKIFKLNPKPDETLLQALARVEDERAEREAAEKRALIRKLNDRREKDLSLDLFGLSEWQEKPNGVFVMEVGPQKHRIALAPKDESDLYEVWARLAPVFANAQKWSNAQPLDWAMQFAEKRAHQLLAGERNLVDKNAPWNSDPPSEKQLKFLRWKKIPIPVNCTKGEASELIDAWHAAHEQKQAKKAEQENDVVQGSLNGDRAFRMMR